MLTVTLPDGSQQAHKGTITALHVAEQIGSGLARAALAAEVDGALVDIDHPITQDTHVRLITAKDPQGLDILRHSCAHVLAHAVKRLFPTAQVTIGPVIENGFYYDFAFARAFTLEDLAAIEAKMQELIKADIPVKRFTMTRDEAIKFFRDLGEEYKVKIIQDIPAGETLSFYQQDDFIDLCRGPHIPSTGKIKAFKLMKVSGAYWRGDPKNEMLQRIYGTAWPDKDALKNYLHMLEEAEKRDHRKIAKAQDLFHLQQESPGMVFWHAKGWTLYRVLMDYMREQLQARGYQEVRTPELVDRSLWERSGHWDKFGKEMFTTESENRDYAIKPMNCPCHVQIFNHALRSYRDLPLRMAEFGSCHRNEPSGALHGLMRVRNLVQDDAHIFCTEAHIESEAGALVDFVFDVYRDFGFEKIDVKLSTRPDERVGADALWDKAEQALAAMLDHRQLQWQENPGEGAFYGPKIEFTLYDCIGRAWQCGTIQLDFCMPERLGAHYIAEDGSKQVPVMLHRAIFGSFERFMGILIEEYAGHFPPWLAPIQAVVSTITDDQADYAQNIVDQLNKQGFRVIADLRNEKVGFKVREHTLQRIPYLLVVGDREKTEGTLAVRTQQGTDLGSMSVNQFVKILNEDVARYARRD